MALSGYQNWGESAACDDMRSVMLTAVSSRWVQVDKLWSLVYSKQKNVAPEHAEKGIYSGDVWTFVAIDADTKLVVSWMVGQRDAGFATEFVSDVKKRLAGRIQLTTKGHKMYLAAVADNFHWNAIGYAQLVKVYGSDPQA